MSKSRSNQNVNYSDLEAILKKKARWQKAIERAMESLESRMMLSVSGFQPAVNYNAGVGPGAVARGDFNSDGRIDLVVANQTGNKVSILSGNGNGTFGAAADYAAGNGPRAVVTGDFNGDGKIDIAVADAAGNNISVLLNNGSGGLNPRIAYNVGTKPLALVAGDFNGDGRTDLAVANYQDNSITVLAGNGDGTFANAQTFSVSPAVNVGTGPNAIVAGDFNGDQKIDLAVSDAGGGVSILLGNGGGGFGTAHLFAAGITPNGLITGIFNGDASLDLAVVNATGDNVSVLLGNGDGTFGSPINYAVGFGPQSITAADFNNDSKMDLAVVNTDSGTVGILYGRGDGTFGAATNKSVGTSPQSVVAGDFNGDGSSDLAVVNQTDDNVSVLLAKHITITGLGGGTAVSTHTNSVADEALTVTGANITAIEGTGFTGKIVASFTDTNLSAVAGDFSATINWGDGSSSTAAVTANAGGGFDVTGGHIYQHAGIDKVVISIAGLGDSKTADATATVDDNTIAIIGSLIIAVEGNEFIGNVVSMADANGAAVKDDFTAMIDWNDGTAPTTATISDKNGGGFNIAGTHTYTLPAGYAPTVTVTGNTGQTFSGAGVLRVVDATLNPASVTILATEGAAFSGTVGTFQDQNHRAVTGDFSASINWGDGHTDTGNITATGNGAFAISGGHTWASAGSRNVVVTINDGGGAQATISLTAMVGDANLASTGKTLDTTEGIALGNTVIAHFADANPSASANDFSVTIDWNHSTELRSSPLPSEGVRSRLDDSTTIDANLNGGFDVMANHTYNHSGNQTYAVTIHDSGGGSTTAIGTVHVANAVLTPSSAAFNAVEGVAFTGQVVAHFTDVNPNASADDFTATVFWGDLTPADTNTNIVANDDGGFDILAGHTYAHAGDKILGIQINGAGGTIVSTPNTAHVDNGELIPTGYRVTAIEGTAYTGIVAHFTDANAAAIAGEFTAAINWGDGTTGTGTISANDNGGFDVTATHTYNPQGTRTITTTITGQGNGEAVAHSTMLVQDALLNSAGKTIAGTLNVGLNNVVIASFVDGNPLDAASHFSAVITWETGSTSVGTIIQTSTGHYNVTGSHTYSTAGNKTASVLIQDEGGSLQIVDAAVNVAGPGLNATFTPFTATEGTGFTGKLTHFTTTLGGAVAGNFTALIDWADGTTTAGTVIPGANGGFDVNGGHTWRLGGYKPVSVRVNNAGSGAYVIAGSNNYVGVKPIAAKGVSLKGKALIPLAATIANFTSANPLAITGDFTATILWGDGTSSAGTVVAKAGGGYAVLAAHAYAAKGTFTAKVTINGISGATAVATSRITVAKGVVSSGPTVGGGHGTPPPTTHGGNPSVRELKFGAWDKPQQLFHGI